MTSPTGLAVDLPSMLADIHFGVDQAAGHVNTIIGGINAVLDHLPDPIVAGIRNSVAQLHLAFTDTVTELGDILAHGGDPEALRVAGAAWATDIGGTASRLAGLATLNTTQADDHWTGIAADAYRNSLIPQKDALIAVKNIGDQVDATLNELANSIFEFWIAIALACLTLVIALTAAAATAATAVGAPVAAGIGVAAISAFGAAMTAAIDNLTDITNDAATNSAGLERLLANDTAFPNGTWPRSTTDISDGSITDGDDTDWHLR